MGSNVNQTPTVTVYGEYANVKLTCENNPEEDKNLPKYRLSSIEFTHSHQPTTETDENNPNLLRNLREQELKIAKCLDTMDSIRTLDLEKTLSKNDVKHVCDKTNFEIKFCLAELQSTRLTLLKKLYEEVNVEPFPSKKRLLELEIGRLEHQVK